MLPLLQDLLLVRLNRHRNRNRKGMTEALISMAVQWASYKVGRQLTGDRIKRTVTISSARRHD